MLGFDEEVAVGEQSQTHLYQTVDCVDKKPKDRRQELCCICNRFYQDGYIAGAIQTSLWVTQIFFSTGTSCPHPG